VLEEEEEADEAEKDGYSGQRVVGMRHNVLVVAAQPYYDCFNRLYLLSSPYIGVFVPSN
jgi:hypothetical protein